MCPDTPRPLSRVQQRRQAEESVLRELTSAVSQLCISVRQHQVQYALDHQAVTDQMTQVQQAFVSIAEGVMPRALAHIADSHRLQVLSFQHLQEQEARVNFLGGNGQLYDSDPVICALCQQRLSQSPPPL